MNEFYMHNYVWCLSTFIEQFKHGFTKPFILNSSNITYILFYYLELCFFFQLSRSRFSSRDNNNPNAAKLNRNNNQQNSDPFTSQRESNNVRNSNTRNSSSNRFRSTSTTTSLRPTEPSTVAPTKPTKKER